MPVLTDRGRKIFEVTVRPVARSDLEVTGRDVLLDEDIAEALWDGCIVIAIVRFQTTHAPEVAQLCAELGWQTFADPAVVGQAFTNPGVCSYVALEDRSVVGFAQAFGDGIVQSYLALLAVAASHRRQGIARQLVEAAFRGTSTARMDVLTDTELLFYTSFRHQTKAGFRVYPQT